VGHDALLIRLRPKLERLGVGCQPEADHSNDKRADLQLTFKTEFELPVEIKCEWNDSLWPALHDQLISQYTIAPKAFGQGIYLVLWFGLKRIPSLPDGSPPPQNPSDLRKILEARMSHAERTLISVYVMDVSWPS
jgi:hypothetical protein